MRKRDFIIHMPPVLLVLMVTVILAGSLHAATSFKKLTLPSLNANISGWTGGGAYDTIFPGTRTWNNVPFALESRSGNKVFLGQKTDIPADVFGAVRAYTLINSTYGQNGIKVGTVEFFGFNGAYAKKDLVEGVNIRDHYNGSYNNKINNVDALEAFKGSTGVRLDMQVYTLPQEFARQILETIRVTRLHLGNPQGNPFIAATTVEYRLYLEEAILVLRALSGMDPEVSASPSSDINGDGKIGSRMRYTCFYSRQG